MNSAPYSRNMRGEPNSDVWCDDPRAENAGADQPCSYDCATLQSFYFPDEDSRCFAYDVATGWPAGEHDRLHVLAGLGFHSVAVLQSSSA